MTDNSAIADCQWFQESQDKARCQKFHLTFQRIGVKQEHPEMEIVRGTGAQLQGPAARRALCREEQRYQSPQLTLNIKL